MGHTTAQLVDFPVAALEPAHAARVDRPHGQTTVLVELAATPARWQPTGAARACHLRDPQGQGVQGDATHRLA